MLATGANKLQAAPIYVPNASFELPETTFVDVNINSWQMPPMPAWYDESGMGPWAQLTGVFLNLPPEDPGHIDNCDANQAAWLFAVPEVELFQDLTATFGAGQSYHLTVGIIGGGGGMKDDVPIEIRLYYRDIENKKVTVGAKTYTYDLDTGYVPHLNDIQMDIPQVMSTDSWAGKNIGVQLVSTLTFPEDLDPVTGRAGGYWDLDNVRLTKLGPDFTGDSFVNLKDFTVMAREWLLCTETTTDLTDDGCVTMEDLTILVEFWLESM
ncbi:MAG: hypothetical protein ACYTEO_03550 [Planctomycetota bacterium]